jgi:hypothetical protein
MLHLRCRILVTLSSIKHHGKGNAVPDRLVLSKADMFSDGNWKEHKATRATTRLRGDGAGLHSKGVILRRYYTRFLQRGEKMMWRWEQPFDFGLSAPRCAGLFLQ